MKLCGLMLKDIFLNKELKFNTNKQNVWFVSDLHLNHAKSFVFEARGFKTIEEHNAFIINKINELVRPDDVLFSLGDFCLNSSEENFESFISRINCQNIYYLWGNHPNPSRKVFLREVAKLGIGDVEVYPFRYKNLIFIGNHAEIIVNGQFIVLNHFPLFCWNHMSKFSWMLTGHEHGEMESLLPNCDSKKICDMGWDVFNKPMSFNEMKPIMDKKKVGFTGHHV